MALYCQRPFLARIFRSLDWCLDQIENYRKSSEDDSGRFHLARWANKAPVELLKQRLDRIGSIKEFDRKLSRDQPTRLGEIQRRIEIWDLPPEECWRQLEEHCRSKKDAASFSDANIPVGRAPWIDQLDENK